MVKRPRDFGDTRCWKCVVAVLVAALSLPGAANATFPGQNGKIAFGMDRPSGFGIYVVEPDGTGLRELLPGGWDPAWSADGNRLAYADGGLRVARGDGTAQTLIRTATTSVSGTVSTRNVFTEPAWSPDGNTIVYVHEQHVIGSGYGYVDAKGLRVIRPDGTDDRLLIDWLGSDPSYSPDGSRLVWDSHRIVVEPRITVSNSDGTGRVALTQLDPDGGDAWKGSARDPSWSPDGTKIAFAMVPDRFAPSQIHVMNSDGSAKQQLTVAERGAGLPVWSPDGTKIAYSGEGGLWVMNADGSGQTRLLSLPDDVFSISGFDWQPLVGPRPGDFKNASHFCKAERQRLGREEFEQRYGSHGGCVSGRH